MAKKIPQRAPRSTPKIPGLYLKHGLFCYQPPQRDGVRPPPIHLGTADLERAVAMRRDVIDRAFSAAARQPMAQAVARFLAVRSAAGEHRPATTRSHGWNLKRFTAAFPGSPAQVEAAAVLAWRDAMLAEGLSRASVRAYMTSAQALFGWLEETGQVLRSPFAELPRRALPQNLPTRRELACTKAQRDLLLSGPARNLELRAVLHFGFLAGLRRGEILALRPGWVLADASGRPAFVHVQNETGADGSQPFAIKDGAAKMIPICEPLADFLLGEFDLPGRAAAAARAGGSPYLIAPERSHVPGGHPRRWEWRRAWRTYVTAQGLAWVTPHVMRRTFISLLLSAPSDRRPSLLHLERWTGTDTATLKSAYAHLLEDRDLINAAN